MAGLCHFAPEAAERAAQGNTIIPPPADGVASLRRVGQPLELESTIAPQPLLYHFVCESSRWLLALAC